VILISTGQDLGGFVAAVDGFRKAGVSVSTIGFGDADLIVLKNIADETGGRLYVADRPDDIAVLVSRDLHAYGLVTSGHSTPAP
jgi:hypothetical protein